MAQAEIILMSCYLTFNHIRTHMKHTLTGPRTFPGGLPLTMTNTRLTLMMKEHISLMLKPMTAKHVLQ